MKNRMWPLIVLFVAPVLVAVSLSMPWEVATCGSAGQKFFSGTGGASAGLQNLFACSFSHVDGWSSIGDVAALASVLLALLAGTVFLRPDRRASLPLGQSALLVAYFTVGVGVETHIQAHQIARQLGQANGADGGVHFHIAYGAYVGLAAAALALLGAGATAREGLMSVHPSVRDLAMTGLAIALLVSLLLPWERLGIAAPEVRQLGLLKPPGAIAAVLAVRVIAVCWRARGSVSPERLALALGALLFAGAALTLGFGEEHVYGAWFGLATAVLLVLASARDAAAVRTLPAAIYGGAVGIAGTVFVTSLFLPWQTACYGADLKALGVSGRCISSNGLGLVGSTAAVLAIVLALTLILAAALVPSRLELVAAFGLLVATLGFQLKTGTESGVRLSVGYGAIIGSVAAASLVALTLARFRPRRANLTGATRPTSVPIILAVAYVMAVVVPWWGVLPSSVWSTFVPRLASVSWLTIASALLGVRLARIWGRQVMPSSDHATELVAVSLGLVALAILEMLPLPTIRVTWNSAVLLGLTVPLALLALIEARGGFRSLQVPAILRIDRI